MKNTSKLFMFLTLTIVVVGGFMFVNLQNANASQCVPKTCDSLTNVALGKPASATISNGPGEGPQNTVDGNLSTSWNTDPIVADGRPASLTISLLQEYPVTSFSLACEGSHGGNNGTINFYNSANQIVQTKSYTACSYGNSVQGSFASTNVSKVVISATSNGDNIGILEFQLFSNQSVCGTQSDGCGGQITCQACQTSVCNSDSACGTTGYTGSPFCQGNSIYQNYTTYTCNNPGLSNSSCSSVVTQRPLSACSASQTCSNGACVNQNFICSKNSDCGTSGLTGSLFCQGNAIFQNFITYTCNNPGTSTSSCSNTTTPQLQNNCSANQTCSNGACIGQNNYYNTCTYHSYERCLNNGLYWYDSCGNQQDLAQVCQNGCNGNTCNNYNYNYNYNYNNCTDYSYKLCVGNNIYWYNSCGVQQGIYETCNGSATCQNGNCVATYVPVIPVVPAYIAHYYTKCSGNNVYWYDSYGAINALYKTCNDNNSCTTDSCSGRICSNTLKCDGSACATGSADYVKYCGGTNPVAITGLSVSFFVKSSPSSTQWQKTIQVAPNSTSYFMISAVNNLSAAINNVNISANIPGQITSIGNLQVNGTPLSGDIISGINIGTLSANETKTITFEGKTQAFSAEADNQQAMASASANGTMQSDSLNISFNPSSSATASVSTAQSTNGFWEFVKRWYLWILALLILIFLFVVVFRRLSSNN